MADLSPLQKALFQTTLEGETEYLFNLLEGFEKGSVYPRQAFHSGEAAKYLRPHLLDALRATVENVESQMMKKRSRMAKERRKFVFVRNRPIRKPKGVKISDFDDEKEVKDDDVEKGQIYDQTIDVGGDFAQKQGKKQINEKKEELSGDTSQK